MKLSWDGFLWDSLGKKKQNATLRMKPPNRLGFWLYDALCIFFTKPLHNDYPWFSVCLFFPCIVKQIHQNPHTNGQQFHKIQQCRYLLNPWCDMETGPVSHWKKVWPVWFVCFHAVGFWRLNGVEPPSRLRKCPRGVRETIQGSHRWGVGSGTSKLVLLVGCFLLFQKGVLYGIVRLSVFGGV